MSAEMWWILLVEDESEVREMFRNAILKKIDGMGMLAHIVEAADGQEAMAKASARSFDCIVTDLRMPKMSGSEMVQSIQGQALNSNAPIIVISAFAENEFKPFRSEYDHIKFLSKPCTPDEVANAVVKEIGYGKRDERISVHLINPFLKTLQARWGESSLQIRKPFVKKNGERLRGDIHCLMTLSSEFSKAYFCVSFAKSFLLQGHPEAEDELVDVNFQKALSKKLHQLAREFVLAWVEEAMPHLKVRLGGQPRLIGLTQVLRSDSGAPGLGALEKARSIVLGLDLKGSEIFLCALARRDFPAIHKDNIAS
jgi:CheY-like chemotaxis protein